MQWEPNLSVRTVKHDKANSHFSKFCEAPKKELKSYLADLSPQLSLCARNKQNFIEIKISLYLAMLDTREHTEVSDT